MGHANGCVLFLALKEAARRAIRDRAHCALSQDEHGLYLSLLPGCPMRSWSAGANLPDDNVLLHVVSRIAVHVLEQDRIGRRRLVAGFHPDDLDSYNYTAFMLVAQERLYEMVVSCLRTLAARRIARGRLRHHAPSTRSAPCQ
jgi:hypothetical protein